MQEETSFGEWLRKQRRALDLSRQIFAKQVGCAEVTLRRIEVGTLKPSKELARLLVEKLSIPEAERAHWISFARGLSGFPHSSSPASNKPNTNLPAPLTTFIGREKEQLDVIRLITKNRLITLAGSGGVGKTRLSIKVGEQVLENYADGVWLVELAPILDPSLIPHTTARILGLREDPQRPIIDILCDYLQEKRMLLLLDNCEHVLDASAQLIDVILKTCPHLKILATSREPLNMTGEAIYRVPSLGLPDLEQILDTFRNYESIQLFEERVQLVQFDFSLTLGNAASVAQICQCLDGIPLAIELAAAKVAVFSTEQIAKQLQESFDLLVEGSRTALPRHQTLRASINWSWNLLTESEQRLMQQLSVFAGGWTLKAAQSVCDGDVLYLLNSLVAKSLVVMNQRAETSTRYSFHETIRQYAHEKLLEAQGVEALRDKHLAYYVKLAEQAEPELYRSNQVFWLNKLDDDLDNVRGALGWALTTDVKSGLRLMVALQCYWEARSDFRGVEGWLAQLLEHYEEADSLCVRALVIYAKVLTDRGVFVEAEKIANQSLELSRAISDQSAEALSLWALGVSLLQSDLKQGGSIIEQSLALYESLGDKLGQATALDWLMYHNEPEHSKAYLLKSLRLYRELGHLSGIAMCLGDLAQLMIDGGDFSSSKPVLEEALRLYRQLGNPTGEAWMLALYGKIAFGQSDYQQAYPYFEQATMIYENLGVRWADWTRASLAYAFLRQGDIVQARETFKISLEQFQKYDNEIGLVYPIEGLASLLVIQGQAERAARLFAWADATREKFDQPRPPVEQNSVERDLEIIHAKLNETEFAKLWEEGRAMTVEQAIALALEPAE
jgi:predicted ATPase/DNA-binding XRE family transcriptional regulator